jgi:2-succinyl-6-hydroxy-2,4-cyclohexadiene-1-carboxylate synthase
MYSTTLKKGPGIPLVFLHGFLGNCLDWEAVCSYLPPCHCIGFDLPGHGKSAFEETIDIPLPFFHLIGYSMGARLSLQIPAQKIASLTLLSLHPGLKTEEEKEQRRKSDALWAELLLELPIDEFLNRWYNQPIFGLFRPKLSMRNKQNKSDLAKALLHYSLAKQPYYKLDHVLIGERDEKFLTLHESPIVIPNAWHQIHLENPKAVAQIITQRLFS